MTKIDKKLLDELLDSMGGDWSFIQELLDAFFEDGPVQIDILDQGMSESNSEAIRRVAHTIKSNARSFGATDLMNVSKELEDVGKEGDLSSAPALISKLKEEFETAIAELKDLYNQG